MVMVATAAALTFKFNGLMTIGAHNMLSAFYKVFVKINKFLAVWALNLNIVIVLIVILFIFVIFIIA